MQQHRGTNCPPSGPPPLDTLHTAKTLLQLRGLLQAWPLPAWGLTVGTWLLHLHNHIADPTKRSWGCFGLLAKGTLDGCTQRTTGPWPCCWSELQGGVEHQCDTGSSLPGAHCNKQRSGVAVLLWRMSSPCAGEALGCWHIQRHRGRTAAGCSRISNAAPWLRVVGVTKHQPLKPRWASWANPTRTDRCDHRAPTR